METPGTAAQSSAAAQSTETVPAGPDVEPTHAFGNFDVNRGPAEADFFLGNLSNDMASGARAGAREELHRGGLTMAQCVALAGGQKAEAGFAFVDPAEGPLACLRRLDKFVSEVQQASRREGAGVDEGSRTCLENMSRMLHKTTWFNGKSSTDDAMLSQLGHLVNKLSKVRSGSGPHAGIANGAAAALSWAAAQVAHIEPSEQIPPRTVGMLLNGLCKLPGDMRRASR